MAVAGVAVVTGGGRREAVGDRDSETPRGLTCRIPRFCSICRRLMRADGGRTNCTRRGGGFTTSLLAAAASRSVCVIVLDCLAPLACASDVFVALEFVTEVWLRPLDVASACAFVFVPVCGAATVRWEVRGM